MMSMYCVRLQARLREESEEYMRRHPEIGRIMAYYTARGACTTEFNGCR